MALNNNKKNQNNYLNFKEAASKLDISESTIKKYMKDFDLDLEKGSSGRSVVSEEIFQALSEIVKLRANGLSIQEIKELKSQRPLKSVLDQDGETIETKKEEETEESEEGLKGLKGLKIDAETLVEISKDAGEKINILDEVDNDLTEDKTLEPGESSEEKTEEAHEEREEHESEPQLTRRRGFNYRYVERQISNDSKRVSSLRFRLKNTNISVQERLFVEEALERRILFLDGWKHILRWISK